MAASASGDRVLDTGVLGGGFCGLLVGNELARRGADFLVLEKENEPGGLARTVLFDDIPGDTGPHALYSRNAEVLRFFRSLPVRYDTHRRKVRVVHHGSDGKIHGVDYPFENGLGDLPIAERAECLIGYVEAFSRRRRDFADLKDWIENGLGSGIARHFMLPYNRKIWNAPLERISMGLVRNKIEPAPVGVVVSSAMGVRTVGRAVQAVFLYPRGGIGEICRVLARGITSRLVTGAPARSLSRERGLYVVTTPAGSFRFRRLISTIPLVEFLALQPYRELRRHAPAFAGNDTVFTAVALKPGRRFRRFADCHWLFFAGPELFYRVNMMHNFHRSTFQHLVAETTWKGAVRTLSARDLESRVLADLRRAGLLGARGDVSRSSSRLVRFTYPIPTVGLSETVARLDAAFARRGISLLGRSGHWDYINMDQVVEKVWEFFGRYCAGKRGGIS